MHLGDWWLKPFIMLLWLGASIGYLTWAALQGTDYAWGPYISPMYATPWMPSWWKISPAFLLLWIPIGFRATCYYARKVYHRSIFLDPADCTVPEPYRKNYKGETVFPFILNNLHRYFLYLALLLMALHWFEFFPSLRYEGSWYLGVGTLLLLIDTVALSLYVFSCHSWRHLIDGGKRRVLSGSCGDCSCHPRPDRGSRQKNTKQKDFFSSGFWIPAFAGMTKRAAIYRGVSLLNQFHGLWFWVSLFSIIAADLYVRLLVAGVFNVDLHITF